MDSKIQENSKDQLKSGQRETGFPEPFNSCSNTTLPHPCADTSSNPSLETNIEYRENSEHRHRPIQDFFRHFNLQTLFTNDKGLKNNETLRTDKLASYNNCTENSSKKPANECFKCGT
ncbi:hypothetical protein HI914_03204 [Erysiphe necator]|nr:hypothetical protein HI914_03204 [Erysiphe necator]